MSQNTSFFLSSMESARFAGVYECETLALVTLGQGRHAIHAACSPPVEASEFGYPLGLESVVLANRFAGDDPWRKFSFPVFVYICAPEFEAEPRVLAWGEIYASAEDARQHRMGRP
ncbi:hypothetical protein FB468_3299 [Leucobacter komagatae]|uniref:Uncharacterized protein n=1 Tax=Leucobacter komagatae TaxID=55969 RepID=A0A542XY64_9MICO|nr:hypothetical protein [Leucobacter komagatae]TQL40775.1 hypothetical protein FB468_3299 [Leucobacter komagatae]